MPRQGEGLVHIGAVLRFTPHSPSHMFAGQPAFICVLLLSQKSLVQMPGTGGQKGGRAHGCPQGLFTRPGRGGTPEDESGPPPAFVHKGLLERSHVCLSLLCPRPCPLCNGTGEQLWQKLAGLPV